MSYIIFHHIKRPTSLSLYLNGLYMNKYIVTIFTEIFIIKDTTSYLC